jgi:hypothetical protein
MEEGRRKPAFLVFDIETIADGDLVSRIRYPGPASPPPRRSPATARS